MSRADGTPPGDGWLDDLFVDYSRRRAAGENPAPPTGPTSPQTAPELPPLQPPLTAYAEDDFTAPMAAVGPTPMRPVASRPPIDDAPTVVLSSALAALDDEAPTTVIPVIPRGTAELSADQAELLHRLSSRGETRASGTARARGRKPRRRRVLVRAAVSAVAFSLVLVMSAVAIAGALYEKYNHQLKRVAVLQTHDKSIVDPKRQQNAENFLVIGSDSRAGLSKSFGDAAGARSDTTMIVHLSPSHTQATIISIPRDSWVSIPACKDSHGKTVKAHTDMFNSAFSIGGPSCTIAAVQRLTGIAVTHFVEIDFKGFESMVNAIGTVTVCSPEKVDDKGSGLHLHVGNNSLNGSQALAYVRARESLGDGSDLGRIKRQQMFMGAVLRQAMTGSTLANPAKLTSFLDAATKAITIDRDTTFGDLRTLASSLQGLNTKRVTFYTAPIANPDYSPPGTSMSGRVLLDTTQGRALYDSVIQDRKPVWVTDKNGKTTIVAGTPSGTPTAPTPSTTKTAPLPKANLNAAQKTCSL